jgi:hypothetical protein
MKKVYLVVKHYQVIEAYSFLSLAKARIKELDQKDKQTLYSIKEVLIDTKIKPFDNLVIKS